MNRLAPLITRSSTLRALPQSASVVAFPPAFESLSEGEWHEDFRFFATAWLGAFLFVTTLIS